MNNTITRIINTATKKVEEMKWNIQYSEEKKKYRAILMHIKMQLSNLKGLVVNEDIIQN